MTFPGRAGRQEKLRGLAVDLEGGSALAGADDGDPMAEARETKLDLSRHHGDAVDFRGVGFGYEDD